MAGGWGSKKNGVCIGVFWDGIAITDGGARAHITDPRVAIDRDQNITDTVNNLSVSGGAVDDDSWSNLDCSGSGDERIKNVAYQHRDLVYGATHTATFQATLKGIDYAGGDLTVSKTITFPARAYGVPTAPTGVTATRVNDGQFTVAWTRTATTDKPYTTQYIERQQDGGSFVQIASVGGTVVSYTDPTTTPNHSYAWRVRAQNSAGYGPYSAASPLAYTTPAAPTNPTVSKAGTSITISVTDNAPHNTAFNVYHSEAGAAYVLLASPAAMPYVHANANAAATHQYRVTATIGALESAYAETEIVQLQAPPLAPTVTVTPVEDLALNDLDVYWTHHPVDSTAQTAAQVRYRAVGTPDWVTVTLTTETVYTIPAGTLPNGATYETQVATRGAHADYGPFSASALTKGSAIPSVTITAPPAAVDASTLTVAWTYADPESTAQSAWRVTLYDATGETVLHRSDGQGPDSTYLVPYALANTTDYVVGVIAWDGDGMASYEATAAFHTDFLPPPTPDLLARFNPESGAVELTITVRPPVVGTEVAAQYVNAYRDGRLVATVPAGDGVETRRNYETHPRADATIWYVWAGTGGVANQYNMADTRFAGGNALGADWTAPSSDGPTVGASTAVAMAAGEVWTVSYRYEMAGALLGSVQLAGNVVTATEEHGEYDHGDGTRTAWGVFTITSGAGAVQPEFIMTPQVAGGWLVIGEAKVEKVGTWLPYFDGGYNLAENLTPSWVGAVNASESILTAGVPQTVHDRIPPIAATPNYVAEAVSTTPTSARTDDHPVSTASPWVYLNGGEAWAIVARLKARPEVEEAVEREKTLHHFAGHTKPIEFIGEARTKVLSVSGRVAGFTSKAEFARWEPWVLMADLPAPLCYRDPIGRRLFVSIGETVVSHNNDSDMAEVSTTLTEVDYTDG